MMNKKKKISEEPDIHYTGWNLVNTYSEEPDLHYTGRNLMYTTQGGT